MKDVKLLSGAILMILPVMTLLLTIGSGPEINWGMMGIGTAMFGGGIGLVGFSLLKKEEPVTPLPSGA